MSRIIIIQATQTQLTRQFSATVDTNMFMEEKVVVICGHELNTVHNCTCLRTVWVFSISVNVPKKGHKTGHCKIRIFR